MKKLKLLILYTFLVLFGLEISAQNRKIEIRDLETDNFPDVKGKLWVRNPDGIDSKTIHFIENQEDVQIKFESFRKPDSYPSNKRVVFLVTNGPSNADFANNITILTSALQAPIIRKGDKIDIVSFNCRKANGDVLVDFQPPFKFTDNPDEIKKRLDGLKFYNRSNVACQSCGYNQSDINYGVFKTLEFLEKEDLSIPTAIIVIGNNKGVRRAYSGESPGERADRLNVSIYGITFPFDNLLDGNVEELSTSSHGLFINCKSLQTAVEGIVSCMGQIIPRSQGGYFPISYTTRYEKDGLTHQSTIRIDKNKEEFSFIVNAPKMSTGEWIKNNKGLAALIAFLTLAIIAAVIFLIINSRKQTQLAQKLEKQRVEELARKQAEADDKLQRNKRELEEVRSTQLREKQQMERQRQDVQNEQDRKEQTVKMMERGNFPWIEFYYEGGSGSFEMDSPDMIAGRQNDCDWCIPHATVSRKHFKITFRDHTFTIEDLGSSNGTYVNGAQISKSVLNHGDVIEFGEIRTTFHI